MPSVYLDVNIAMRVGLLEEMETGNSRVSVTGKPELVAAYGVAADPLLGRGQAPPTSMTPMHIRARPTSRLACSRATYPLCTRVRIKTNTAPPTIKTKPMTHNSPP